MNEAIDAFIAGLEAPIKDPQQETVLCYEIGAAYELRPGIHLLGRLKFFDSRTVFRETALDGMGGSFYVGTSFGF